MKFFNEKWNNSSIVTKASAWIMAFVTLLFLVSVFIILSWNSKLGGGIGGLAFLYFLLFVIFGLITFGLFKVNRIARGLMIWAFISYLICVILSFSVVGYVMNYAKTVTNGTAGAIAGNAASAAGKLAGNAATSALAAQAASQIKASGITGIIVKAVINAIPASVLASIGFYLFVFLAPMYLIVLSGLLLIFCGKDFKRKNKELEAAVS